MRLETSRDYLPCRRLVITLDTLVGKVDECQRFMAFVELVGVLIVLAVRIEKRG